MNRKPEGSNGGSSLRIFAQKEFRKKTVFWTYNFALPEFLLKWKPLR
jgi:hypothetical protein